MSTPPMKRMPPHGQPRSAAPLGRQLELSIFSTGWTRTLWIDKNFFLILQRMPRTRDEENMLQKEPNPNFINWLLRLSSLLMPTKRFGKTLLQILATIQSLSITILDGRFSFLIFQFVLISLLYVAEGVLYIQWEAGANRCWSAIGRCWGGE